MDTQASLDFLVKIPSDVVTIVDFTHWNPFNEVGNKDTEVL